MSDFALWGLDPQNPEHQQRMALARLHQNPPNSSYITALMEPSLTLEDALERLPFAQVKVVLMATPKLSTNARVLYFLLRAYAWQKDHAFPGQDTLSLQLGANVRTTQRALRELIDLQLVSTRRRGMGLPNVYTLKRLTVPLVRSLLVDGVPLPGGLPDLGEEPAGGAGENAG